jgi:hypothetical protein
METRQRKFHGANAAAGNSLGFEDVHPKTRLSQFDGCG